MLEKLQKSIQDKQEFSYCMGKSIRIDNEKIHDELIQLLLNLQAERGEKLKMEDLLRILLDNYYKKKR